MNELDIKRHSFDLAKNRLKEFSEKAKAEKAIDRVKTGGWFFGWGNHRVTGHELNERMESIQGHFIDINSTNNEIIKEFREVYSALDALDKDYIQSIVASVKAIEKTNNDVKMQQGTLKQHNEKLASQQSKLDSHQIEIDKNVANMAKIVTTLKAFKEKLDDYKHLTDIDRIWSDCKTIRNDIQVISNSITAISKKATSDIATARNDIQVVSDSITALSKKTTNDITAANLKNKTLLEQVNKDISALRREANTYINLFSDLTEKIEDTAKRLDEQIPVIQDVWKFVNQIKDIAHLNDVDSMWDNLSNIKTEINDIYEDINKSNGVIEKHQGDLERLNADSKEHKETLASLSQNQNETKEYAQNNRELILELQAFRGKVDSIEHIADVDSMWEQGNVLKTDLTEVNDNIVSLQEKTLEIDKEIADKTANIKGTVSLLEKKLKHAYLIAGGALGLAVVELIFALTGVI